VWAAWVLTADFTESMGGALGFGRGVVRIALGGRAGHGRGMRRCAYFILIVMMMVGVTAGRAAEAVVIALPVRPADAVGGAEFARRVETLEREAREEAVLAEVRRGNVPAFWRRFVEVKMGGAVLWVAPEYLCVGSDEDYWLAPLTPGAAQRMADELGCVLPTRKMVTAIWRAAPLKLEPRPLPRVRR
jgi:hypothetical protein